MRIDQRANSLDLLGVVELVVIILGPAIAIGLLALRANSLISREVLPRVRETFCGCYWYRPDSSGVVRVLGTA